MIVEDVIAPKLRIIFLWLIRRGSFPVCWRSANVTASPNRASYPDMKSYHPLSITPILSKVYGKLVSHTLIQKLVSQWEVSFSNAYTKNVFFCLLLSQFAYRKALGCTDALLTISHHLQKSLGTGMESYIVQLDFSVTFDRVSHSALLLKLKSIGVGGSVQSICMEFLSNRRQRVVVDGAASEWITIVPGVPQGSVLGPLLFILYTSEMCELVENRLCAYADDSTLVAVVRNSRQTCCCCLP